MEVPGPNRNLQLRCTLQYGTVVRDTNAGPRTHSSDPSFAVLILFWARLSVPQFSRL